MDRAHVTHPAVGPHVRALKHELREEDPVLVVGLGEEREGPTRADREGATADERLLESADQPPRVTEDRVVVHVALEVPAACTLSCSAKSASTSSIRRNGSPLPVRRSWRPGRPNCDAGVVLMSSSRNRRASNPHIRAMSRPRLRLKPRSESRWRSDVLLVAAPGKDLLRTGRHRDHGHGGGRRGHEQLGKGSQRGVGADENRKAASSPSRSARTAAAGTGEPRRRHENAVHAATSCCPAGSGGRAHESTCDGSCMAAASPSLRFGVTGGCGLLGAAGTRQPKLCVTDSFFFGKLNRGHGPYRFPSRMGRMG